MVVSDALKGLCRGRAANVHNYYLVTMESGLGGAGEGSGHLAE